MFAVGCASSPVTPSPAPHADPVPDAAVDAAAEEEIAPDVADIEDVTPDAGEDAPDVGALPDAPPIDAAVPDTAAFDIGPQPEPSPAGACGASYPIACDAPVAGSAAEAPTGQVVDTTPCNAFFYPAPEVVYAFTSPGKGTVEAALDGLGQTLDLLVLPALQGGCDLVTCAAWAPDHAKVAVTPGQRLYFVVDGYQGAKGPFTLSLDCSGVDTSPPTCAPTATIGCDESQTLPAAGAPKVLADYACGPKGLTGPERALTFVASMTGTATVTVGDGDGTILVLAQGCDPAACLASGEGTVTFPIADGDAFDLVVDTFEAFNGNLSVTVSCQPGP